jgi:hypothetical protein
MRLYIQKLSFLNSLLESFLRLIEPITPGFKAKGFIINLIKVGNSLGFALGEFELNRKFGILIIHRIHN